MEKNTQATPSRPNLPAASEKIVIWQKGTMRRLRNSQGNIPSIQLYYENYSYLLTEEIYNRSGRKTIFE